MAEITNHYKPLQLHILGTGRIVNVNIVIKLEYCYDHIVILDIIFTVNTISVKTTRNTKIVRLKPTVSDSPHSSSLRHGPRTRHLHDVRPDDDVEDAHHVLHGLGVELTHVRPGVLQLGLGDVQHPLPLELVVRDGDPLVVRDDVCPDGLDGLTVGLDPAHPVSLRRTL